MNDQNNDLPEQYKGVWSVLRHYWSIYGGLEAFLKSPYLHLSLALTFFVPLWKTNEWFDIPLAVIPSILGFSLAGYAMFLAFGDEAFRTLLAGNYTDGEESPFMGFNSKFLHFIIVQIVAILLAVSAKVQSVESGIIAIISCLFFYYTLLTALATAIEIFRCSRLFDQFAKIRECEKKNTAAKTINLIRILKRNEKP